MFYLKTHFSKVNNYNGSCKNGSNYKFKNNIKTAK